MKPYNPKATCPKCTFGHITSEYKTQQWNNDCQWYEDCEPFMKRTCPNCSYEWEELPADTKPVELPKSCATHYLDFSDLEGRN